MRYWTGLLGQRGVRGTSVYGKMIYRLELSLWAWALESLVGGYESKGSKDGSTTPDNRTAISTDSGVLLLSLALAVDSSLSVLESGLLFSDVFESETLLFWDETSGRFA
jgi:hypothetical protein